MGNAYNVAGDRCLGNPQPGVLNSQASRDFKRWNGRGAPQHWTRDSWSGRQGPAPEPARIGVCADPGSLLRLRPELRTPRHKERMAR